MLHQEHDWRRINKFSLPLAYNLPTPLANGTQGPVPEEMSQTMLTNWKQGKIEEVHATNIINPTKFRLNRKNTFSLIVKSEEPLY